MTLYPTKPTFHVAIAAAAMIAVGIAARSAEVVAYGGGMVLALTIGRAIGLVLVTRIRSAGFDLKWTERSRLTRIASGTEVELGFEIRNWGASTVRATSLRAVASSMLEVVVEPSALELPPASSTRLRIRVRGKRVGFWGIHGFALEVRGAPAGSDGSYEVPLVFNSSFGVEVLPRALASLARSPRGGRARRMTDAGAPSRFAGEGDELRELREHVPGDAFKRIAWKASAKRGQLLVRETNRSERDVVWILLDASVELWAGPLGQAPLDKGVEEVASLAARHLARGDRVGLVVTAARVRAWIPPEAGGARAAIMASALAGASVMVDEDRSELDEREVASRVVEHCQSIDPKLAGYFLRSDLPTLMARLERLRREAPFAPRVPYATTAQGAALRHYLASFGIETPPRQDGERERSDAAIAAALEKIAALRERPSLVYVWAAAPVRQDLLSRAIRRLRARRIALHWSLPRISDSVGPTRPAEGRPLEAGLSEHNLQAVVEEAVRIRARADRARGSALLRRMGAVVPAREARQYRDRT